LKKASFLIPLIFIGFAASGQAYDSCLLYFSKGDYASVIQTYESNTELLTTAIDSIQLLDAVSASYLFSGFADQAKLVLHRAVRTTQKINESEPSEKDALVMNNLGLVYQKEGSFDSAFYCLQLSLKWRTKLKGRDDSSVAESFFNLGTLHAERGSYDQAEEMLKKTLAIDRKTYGQDSPELAMTLNNIGFVNFDCGRFDKAIPYFQEASLIMRGSMGEQSYPYGLTLLNIGNAYLKKENLDSALFYINRSQKILENAQIYLQEYGLARVEMVSVLISQGKLEEAKELIAKLKIEIKERGWTAIEYDLGLAEAKFWMIQGQNAQAERSLEEAQQSFLKHYTTSNHGYWMIKDFQGMLQARRNLLLQSHTTYQDLHKAVLTKTLALFPSFSEKERELYYQQAKPLFEKYLSLLLLPKAPHHLVASQAYNNQLITKAILLNYSNRWKRQLLRSGDVELIRYFTQWQELKERYSQEIENNKSEMNLDSLSEAINILEKKLSTRSGLFSNEIDNKIPVWQDVKKQLKAKEAAIEIIRFRPFDFKDKLGFTEDVYYAALIITAKTRNNPDVVLINMSNDHENRITARYRNHILTRSEEDKDSYQVLWQPLAEKLRGIKRIYISTDGIYNLINFNTFRHPQTRRYVIEDWDIRRVTNTRDLLVKREIEKLNKYALLMGGPDFGSQEGRVDQRKQTDEDFFPFQKERGSDILPLPGAKEEVEVINDLFIKNGWTVDLYVGKEALEEQLKHSLKPRVLHIATHGYFKTDINYEPNQRTYQNALSRSGLLLAGASKTFLVSTIEEESASLYEDGVLTADEAMGLNLENTELVVLSACETGLGEIQNGEGVYGLQRAFWVAGAQCLIMSLWKVDDQVTRLLMEEFYNNWLQNGSKSLAFKQAQLKVMELFPEPYYWGSFVMVGDL